MAEIRPEKYRPDIDPRGVDIGCFRVDILRFLGHEP